MPDKYINVRSRPPSVLYEPVEMRQHQLTVEVMIPAWRLYLIKKSLEPWTILRDAVVTSVTAGQCKHGIYLPKSHYGLYTLGDQGGT